MAVNVVRLIVRGALRRADTVSKAVRISTEVYGGVRRGEYMV